MHQCNSMCILWLVLTLLNVVNCRYRLYAAWYSVGCWLSRVRVDPMMTSWDGNIFRVTGPLWGVSASIRWIPFTKASDLTRSFDVFFDLCLNKRLNNRDAGHLRRHYAPYDLTVMKPVRIGQVWLTKVLQNRLSYSSLQIACCRDMSLFQKYKISSWRSVTLR